VTGKDRECYFGRDTLYFGHEPADLRLLAAATTDNDLPNDLLDPYEKLVRIEVLGNLVEVPEKKPAAALFSIPLR